MGPGDREFGVVEQAAEDALPTVAPETGIEPDPEAEKERSQTWGPKKDDRPAGDDQAGGA